MQNDAPWNDYLIRIANKLAEADLLEYPFTFITTSIILIILIIYLAILQQPLSNITCICAVIVRVKRKITGGKSAKLRLDKKI